MAARVVMAEADIRLILHLQCVFAVAQSRYFRLFKSVLTVE